MKRFYKIYLGLAAIILAVLSVESANGQEFYIKAGGGYTFKGTGSQVFSYNRNELSDGWLANTYVDQDNNSTHEIIRDSYGKGGRINLAFGTRFSQYIGAEIGLDWLFGSAINASALNENSDQQFFFTTHAKMLSLTPAIVISALPESRVNPYMQLGLSIGVYHKITDELTFIDNADETIFTSELKNGISAGITTKLGAEVTLSETVSFFGEFVYNSMSYKPDQLEFTKLTENEKDILDEFLDTTLFNLVSEVDESTGNEKQVYNMPFSALGFNVGVMFNFSGTKRAPRSR